ncbi:MAG: M23 family metallopeptidase [Vulcanibacillus sp.]
MKKINYIIKIILVLSLLATLSMGVYAAEKSDKTAVFEARMELFKNLETIYQIPWYYLAAIDQFERNIQPIRNDIPEKDGLIAIYFSKERWSGLFNPFSNDQEPSNIQYFQGFGVDGDCDGIADSNNDIDVLIAFISFILRYGTSEDEILNALTDYYNEKSAKIITEMATIYKNFGTLNLTERFFPIPKGYNYSYHSTWGDARGWGGRRIHEGTDIFASYGTPVRSVSHGYVEILGWNEYGGWRVGIRGINNIYYYYAHLSSFKKDLKEGDIVEPGTIIGYVGNSGYGPVGTQGKFPPHLHFGIYTYNGRNEWSFDPTPFLRIYKK